MTVKGRVLSNSFGSPMGRSSGYTLLDLCCDDTLAERGSVRQNGSCPKGFLDQSQQVNHQQTGNQCILLSHDRLQQNCIHQRRLYCHPQTLSLLRSGFTSEKADEQCPKELAVLIDEDERNNGFLSLPY